MKMVSKPTSATVRDKDVTAPSGGFMMSDSLSLSSYKDYPVIHPFINTHTPRHTLPSKAFPESSSTAILSALRNLQEKIRTLEKERGRAVQSIYTPDRTATHKVTQPQRHKDTHSHRETSDKSACNQALLTQLAAAEARCSQLEKQLEHMRRMVRSAKSDRTTLLKQQVSMETSRSAYQSHDSCSGHAQLEKLERLEQEYLRLTGTQEHAERKIQELEMKLQEEQHQIKLVQDKANQIQTGLEANRILLQSVSPRPPRSRTKEKRPVSKTPVESPSHAQPHYRLSLGDVPFVTGTSPGCSHSVRANVQSVLSLLKQHQPQLCNARVLSHTPLDHSSALAANHRRPDSGSSSSSSGGEELADLLVALQEELRHMSLEQQDLMRQAEECVSERERRELHRDQEDLLKKMERKGEQISKLHKHQTQVKRLRREVRGQKRGGRGEVRVTTTVTTRGRSAGVVKVGPGNRSKNNLKLLRDMKALQSSLRT
ncbi:centrosomal protein of 57 kDa [Hypomesus transpacificus]|uniref:centrosomal protein of 57 kDa n=1 Tax=Hypomesus transpacificus TaxID=137520 RepID=UPI001F07F204|nr:centrosomal protein of 57 kDa [Hypomesus transpacificus]